MPTLHVSDTLRESPDAADMRRHAGLDQSMVGVRETPSGHARRAGEPEDGHVVRRLEVNDGLEAFKIVHLEQVSFRSAASSR